MPTSDLEVIHQTSWQTVAQGVLHCHLCPRLRKHCQKIATVKRKAYQGETYWGKPISGFGDAAARLILVGLAPGAHGANRTGRVFTGDRSGDWLYKALHKAGFANQPHSVSPASPTSKGDGLTLRDAYVTCVVKCAPPDNKPLPAEQERCSQYLKKEVELLTQARVWVALGQIALKGLWPHLNPGNPLPKFQHGGQVPLGGNRWLLLSYHPSQQNTFTGKLTEPMFDSIFQEARRLLEL